jgi:hypothetical protein
VTRAHTTFVPNSRSARRFRVVLVALALAVSCAGCGLFGGDEGQQVEVVAGGGSADSGKATDTRIPGRVVDMAAAGDTVRLLVDGPGGTELWTVKDGSATKVSLDVDRDDVGQLALDPSGVPHLAVGGQVVTIGDDGTLTAVVGTGRVGRGSDPVPDGTLAADADIFRIEGLSFGRDGTLYYSEALAVPVSVNVVRAVRDGKITTVAGRRPEPGKLSDPANVALLESSRNPKPGTPATQVLLQGSDPVYLTSAPNDTLYAYAGGQVFAVRPDTTIGLAIGGRAPTSFRVAEKPFADRGEAVNAELRTSEPRLAVDTDGALYAVSTARLDALPEAFKWRGEYSGSQRHLAEAAQRVPSLNVVWRVTTEGQLQTASYGGSALATSGEWLYLAEAVQNDSEDETLVVRIHVP